MEIRVIIIYLKRTNKKKNQLRKEKSLMLSLRKEDICVIKKIRIKNIIKIIR